MASAVVIIILHMCLLLITVHSSREEGCYIHYPKVVQEYDDYGSVSLFRFSMPDRVAESAWTFRMEKSESGCPDKDIRVSINRGGLPIVNPYNTSFPDSTTVDHAKGFSFVFNTKVAMPPPASIFGPLSGNWFIIAYMFKAGTDKIDQKGLVTECKYIVQPILSFVQVVEVQILSDLSSNAYQMPEGEDSMYFSYHTKSSTLLIQFEVMDCSGILQNLKSLKGKCPLTITVGAGNIPSNETSLSISCLEEEKCIIYVDGAIRDSWYYLRLEKAIPETITDFTFHIMVEQEECDYTKASSLIVLNSEGNVFSRRGSDGSTEGEFYFSDLSFNNSQLPLAHLNHEKGYQIQTVSSHYRNPMDEACAPLYSLVTIQSSSSTKMFIRLDKNNTNTYPVESGDPIVMAFDVDPVEDVGALFAVGMDASQLPGPYVKLCFKERGPPLNNGQTLDCNGTTLFEKNLTSEGRAHWHIPFPVAGTWYLALEVECYNSSSVYPSTCGEDAEITVELQIEQQCIGNCGKNGQCYVRYRDGVQFHYCRCFYGYQGFGCTDDSKAWSRGYYLIRVIFLTLSNIMFLVATVYAIYLHHFAESVSYLATTVFSTLYHACDSGRVCVMNYDTLQFCDFYASFMSILLTLIAMAKLNPKLTSTSHMIGAFFVAFAAKYDRFSLWAVLVPLSSGLVVVLLSWGSKMYCRKKLYPSKKRWLFFIIPGTVLALLGLVFMTALETEENYFVMHSVWHLLMGSSILFLLPPRRPEKKVEDTERELLDVTSDHRDYTQPEDNVPYSFMTGE